MILNGVRVVFLMFCIMVMLGMFMLIIVFFVDFWSVGSRCIVVLVVVFYLKILGCMFMLSDIVILCVLLRLFVRVVFIVFECRIVCLMFVLWFMLERMRFIVFLNVLWVVMSVISLGLLCMV